MAMALKLEKGKRKQIKRKATGNRCRRQVRKRQKCVRVGLLEIDSMEGGGAA